MPASSHACSARLISFAVGVGLVLAFASAALAQAPSPAAERSITLDQAFALAESTSQSIVIARAGVSRAEGQQKKAFSQFLPQLYGQAAYTRTLQSQYNSALKIDTTAGPPSCNQFVADTTRPIIDQIRLLQHAIGCAAANPFSAFNSFGFGAANQWQVGLQFTQNVFAGGRFMAQYRSSEAATRSAEISLTATEAQLLLQVTQAYFDAQLSDRLVQIAEATLAQAETTLTQTRLAREVGNQPEFDLIRAQVTRDNQVPVVIQRRSDRENAYFQLKTLLRLPIDAPLSLTTSLDDTTPNQSARLASILAEPVDTNISQRAPVRQATENETSGREQLSVAKSQYWPSITLSSFYGGVAYPSNFFPSSTADWRANWTITGALSIPIFTGGSIRGDVMQAEANLREAEARRRGTEDLARIDTRDAMNQLAAARASYEASMGTVTQAARAYQIADVRYRAGISTQTELRDSRLQLQQSQANQAQAARDLRVARVRVALLPSLPIIVSGTTTAPGTSGSLLNPTTTTISPPATTTPRTTQPVTTTTAASRTGQTGVTP